MSSRGPLLPRPQRERRGCHVSSLHRDRVAEFLHIAPLRAHASQTLRGRTSFERSVFHLVSCGLLRVPACGVQSPAIGPVDCGDWGTCMSDPPSKQKGTGRMRPARPLASDAGDALQIPYQFEWGCGQRKFVSEDREVGSAFGITSRRERFHGSLWFPTRK